MKCRPPLVLVRPLLPSSVRRLVGAPPCPLSPPPSIDPYYTGSMRQTRNPGQRRGVPADEAGSDGPAAAAAAGKELLALGAARRRQRQWSRSRGRSFAVADTARLEVLQRTCRRDWKQRPRQRSTALSSSSQPMGTVAIGGRRTSVHFCCPCARGRGETPMFLKAIHDV